MDRRLFLGSLAALAAPRIALAADDVIRMRDLYNKDLSFSDLARALDGKRVTIQGFMAPPLKAESAFFVLTKRPMAVCPFCETSAEWPDDIVAIYTKRIVEVVPFNVRIVSRGVLELGDYRDPETGFLSRVRIVDASTERT
ncbi:hypothetical protein L1787_19070 [Acuticoccus sp. M5D2P5]|uniref:hypothetical protein n=1 Tax=Acuticoccus kalidii TaxID=2910977 RepID=UPI001F19E9C4|nr:hypothetical protein [Acuticoccus kalidii]MCF3935496.1 hypothetical protein [Acuticoccus kalidii]